MPMKSKAQWRYLFGAEARKEVPEGTARRFVRHTDVSYDKLPKKLKKSAVLYGPLDTRDRLAELAVNTVLHKLAEFPMHQALSQTPQQAVKPAVAAPNAAAGVTPPAAKPLVPAGPGPAGLFTPHTPQTVPQQGNAQAAAPMVPQAVKHALLKANKAAKHVPLMTPKSDKATKHVLPMTPLLKRAGGAASAPQAPPAAGQPQQPPPGAFKPSPLMATITTPHSPQALWQAGVRDRLVPQAPAPDHSQSVASGQQLQNNVELQKKAALTTLLGGGSALIDRLAVWSTLAKTANQGYGAYVPPGQVPFHVPPHSPPGVLQGPQASPYGQTGYGTPQGLGASSGGFQASQQAARPSYDQHLLALQKHKAALQALAQQRPAYRVALRQQFRALDAQIAQVLAVQKVETAHYDKQDAERAALEQKHLASNPFEQQQQPQAAPQEDAAKAYRQAYQDHTKRYEAGVAGQGQLDAYQNDYLGKQRKAHEDAFGDSAQMSQLAKANPEAYERLRSGYVGGRLKEEQAAHEKAERAKRIEYQDAPSFSSLPRSMWRSLPANQYQEQPFDVASARKRLEANPGGFDNMTVAQAARTASTGSDQLTPAALAELRQSHAGAYKDPALAGLQEAPSYKRVVEALQDKPGNPALLAQKKQFETNYRQANPYRVSAEQLQQDPDFNEKLQGVHGQQVQQQAQQALQHAQNYGDQQRSWQDYDKGYQQFKQQYGQWNQGQVQPPQPAPQQQASPQQPPWGIGANIWGASETAPAQAQVQPAGGGAGSFTNPFAQVAQPPAAQPAPPPAAAPLSPYQIQTQAPTQAPQPPAPSGTMGGNNAPPPANAQQHPLQPNPGQGSRASFS